MNKNINALVLLLIVLSSCSVRESESPTRVSLTLTPFTIQSTIEIMPIGDGGLITGQPCASPCFFGVRIGETQLDQVIPMLEDSGISPCYMSSDTVLFCGENTISVAIGVNPLTFIVDGIEYDPGVSITVGEIVEKYGNPNFIQVTSGGIPEAPNISALLLWDSINLRVDLPEIEKQNYLVENITQIHSIIFLNGASYSDLTANDYTQPWNGYGTYRPDLNP